MTESPITIVNTNLKIVQEYLASGTTNSELDLPGLQGFLYALTTSACFVVPSSWLMVVCGGVPSFTDETQQKTVLKAFLELYQYVNCTLTTLKAQNFLIWSNSSKLQVPLPESTDAQIGAFCRGYFKGFLLDPIRLGSLEATKDESLLLCLGILKIAGSRAPKSTDSQPPQLIDTKMKLALAYLVLHEYRRWNQIRAQGLTKSYLNEPWDGNEFAASSSAKTSEVQ